MLRAVLRIGLFAFAMMAVIAAAGGGLFYSFWQHFYFDPPRADYPKPNTALEAQRQDLDYFDKLSKFDRSFRPAARKEAEKRIASLEETPKVLPQQTLHTTLMQIMALADNGHTRVGVSVGHRKAMMEPVRLTRFAEGFFVMRAKPEYRDMLGGRLVSIDGVPFAALVQQLETLRGGTEAFRRDYAAMYAEDHDILYGLGIVRDPQNSDWVVVLPDGRAVTHTLTAAPEDYPNTFTYGTRWRSPEPMKGMGDGWISYEPASGTLPETDSDMDNHFLRASVPQSCAAYVRVQEIDDADGQKIQPFLKATEAAFRAHPPCAVIFDLRGNGGGNYTNMWHFTHALPDLVAPGGRIYVLTDPMTFSAAITTTAFLKDAGGNRTLIVGEPVGDRMAFYAEGRSGTLPNSNISVSYETGKHDYGHPCRDVNDCFWLNWLYPVRVKTLQPDILIPSRFADWNAGHDAAFDRAVALVAQEQQRSASRAGN
jgi:hypothetical protein